HELGAGILGVRIPLGGHCHDADDRGLDHGAVEEHRVAQLHRPHVGGRLMVAHPRPLGLAVSGQPFPAIVLGLGLHQPVGHRRAFLRVRPPLAPLPRDEPDGNVACMLIRAATGSDDEAIWAVLEPTIRAGETLMLPTDMSPAAALAYWRSPAHEVFLADAD